MVWEWFGVALGGLIGTVLRHVTGRVAPLFTTTDFPIATLFVNSLGCFLIGLGWAAAERHGWLNTAPDVTFRVGFLGGLTTFSAYGLEIVRFAQQQRYAEAAAILVGNLLFGLIAVYLGMQAGGRL